MEREETLSIKLGLSVTVTCILTVSDDRLCFRNKLKLSGQQEAPKFATQKMAAYGGSQRLYKQNSLLSKMTHEVCISKHELFFPPLLIKKPKNGLLPTFSPDFTWNRQIWLFYAEKWIFFKKLGTLLNPYAATKPFFLDFGWSFEHHISEMNSVTPQFFLHFWHE